MASREPDAPSLGGANDVSCLERRLPQLTPSVLAQLFPATRTGAVPAGAPREAAVEGAEPDLGPHGMYVSLGWEDFDALLPWVELRGAGLQNESRRPGFGFESPEP